MNTFRGSSCSPPSPGDRSGSVNDRRTIGIIPLLVTLSLAWAQTEPAPTFAQLVDIGGGRSLFLECRGAGSPTVILEAGEGNPRSQMSPILVALQETHRVCSYDRANKGRSSRAPTPRTAQEIVDDLEALLAAAQVPTPYVLVGHSAGGMLVQLYAARHPDQVLGVLAMNSVPPADVWFEDAFPLMTEAEQQDERAYYRGANGEGIDYASSSRQIDEAGVPHMPFVVMISTIRQCESTSDICGRTYGVYTEAERAIAEAAPQGRFVEVEAGHEIFLDDLAAVIAAIESLGQR